MLAQRSYLLQYLNKCVTIIHKIPFNFRTFSTDIQTKKPVDGPIENSFIRRYILLPYYRTFYSIYRFDSIAISKRYRLDKVDPKEWCLIYNDPRMDFVDNILKLLSCFILTHVALMFFDYRKMWKFSDEHYARLHHDYYQLGIARYSFVVFALLSFSLILRGISIHLSRIYLNRKDSNKLFVHANRFIFFRTRFQVKRANVLSYDRGHLSMYFSLKNLYLFIGNVRLGKYGFYLTTDAFRSNSFSTYVLNHRDIVPNQLQTLDLENLETMNKNSN